MIRLADLMKSTIRPNVNASSIKYRVSKCGSNGNYDGNDDFSTRQIENKTRQHSVLLYPRIQRRSQDRLSDLVN